MGNMVSQYLIFMDMNQQLKRKNQRKIKYMKVNQSISQIIIKVKNPWMNYKDSIIIRVKNRWMNYKDTIIIKGKNQWMNYKDSSQKKLGKELQIKLFKGNHFNHQKNQVKN